MAFTAFGAIVEAVVGDAIAGKAIRTGDLHEGARECDLIVA
jgi:hypothetical protein